MNLILFFNGWGMDEQVIKDLSVPINYEVKEVHFPYVVKFDQTKYEKIIAVGWSFGCYYLSKYIQENDINCAAVIAINGHGEIIGKYGINPKMLKLTLDTLTPENLQKFYFNMGIDDDFVAPNRVYEDIERELAFFKENYKALPNVFTKAIVSDNDKIIPTSKQLKYFEDNSIAIKMYESGHYIWSKVKNWSELLGDK